MVIGSMKIISNAMETHRASQSPPTYPGSFDELVSATPPYIDAVLVSGTKQGYTYAYSSGTTTCSVTASPVTPNVTGTRVFFVDQSGVIRLNDASGPPVD